MAKGPMPTAGGELPLAEGFPEVSGDRWRELVAGVLARAGRPGLDGAAAEEALSTALADGIVTRPLYTANDQAPDPGFPGFAPFVRGARPEGTAVAGWDVRQFHGAADPARVNEAVLADLENGVTSVWLAVGEGGAPVAALETALDGVLLDLAPVVLDAGAAFDAAARELLRIAEGRGLAPGAVLGVLGADPLGLAAREGDQAELTTRLWAAAGLAARCHRDHPGLRALVVDALPYHEAGGSPAQELGCSLATGVAYLRELTAAGLSVDAALGQLEFRYAATTDQFLTIAKLRAARRLWARVAGASGAAPAAGAQRQHAVTSRVMMTRRDPWVNMLRTTVAALAAGTGGADSVTVLPFDEALGLPDAFARRIARNTSAILLAESHLGRVVDPAGGSWYVERLTDELARAGWAWFQEVERAGGQAAALRSGLVGDRLAEEWARRGRRLATRREPITGVSEFANPGERLPKRAPAPARAGGGLPRVRRDEAFEALRARADEARAAGVEPRVFLAALGPVAAHTARAGFAANLFQAAGIEPVHEPVSVDADTVAAAFGASGAPVACLCSDDARYAEQAAAVAAALKAAGARRVLLAGRPGEREAEYRAAGVDTFVFVGVDAVAVLSALLDVVTEEPVSDAPEVA
ncbi:methylmalonyl-CoA mutase family protein [Streptomyces sp. DSM 44918]|uniref:Methylmalonyl-CoA mutase family protein n=2 Tax=Streptomyces millisiae TaxID=3075542 RepID=A0ABU2LI47_9ACTN|nr:methylmalonyl-CoA mutase family protein [Streptomyces sp. DSM 44918]MDT0317261.1 methylmalonyl-CoA mutase family protein [Streptomyces sp. DSM 44918]